MNTPEEQASDELEPAEARASAELRSAPHVRETAPVNRPKRVDRLLGVSAVWAVGGIVVGRILLRMDPVAADEGTLVRYAVALFLVGLVVVTYEALTAMAAWGVWRARGGPKMRAVRTTPREFRVGSSILVLMAYLGGTVVVTLGVLGFVAMRDPATLDGPLGFPNPVDYPWLLPLASLLAIPAVWYALRRLAKPRDWVTMRRWLRPSPGRVLVLSAAAGIAFAAVASQILQMSPVSSDYEPGLVVQMVNSGQPARLFVVFFAVLVAPPIEEFVFRGVLLQGLGNSFGVTAGVALTSLIFTGLHLGEVAGVWVAGGVLLVGATAVAVLRLRTGRLWPCVTAHAAYNATLTLPLLFGA